MFVLMVKWTRRGKVILFGGFRSVTVARAFFKSEMVHNHKDIEPVSASIHSPNDCPRRCKMLTECVRREGQWV